MGGLRGALQLPWACETTLGRGLGLDSSTGGRWGELWGELGLQGARERRSCPAELAHVPAQTPSQARWLVRPQAARPGGSEAVHGRTQGAAQQQRQQAWGTTTYTGRAGGPRLPGSPSPSSRSSGYQRSWGLGWTGGRHKRRQRGRGQRRGSSCAPPPAPPVPPLQKEAPSPETGTRPASVACRRWLPVGPHRPVEKTHRGSARDRGSQRTSTGGSGGPAPGSRAASQRGAAGPSRRPPQQQGPSYLHGVGRGLMGAGDRQGGGPSASGVPEPLLTELRMSGTLGTGVDRQDVSRRQAGVCRREENRGWTRVLSRRTSAHGHPKTKQWGPGLPGTASTPYMPRAVDHSRCVRQTQDHVQG